MATLAARPISSPTCRSMDISERFSRKASPNSGGFLAAVSASPDWAGTFATASDMNHPSLDRHLHDVLVGLYQLVAHLGHGLEGHRGLLRSDHHIGQVDPALAHFKGRGQLIGGALGLADLVDRLPQQIGDRKSTR